MVACVHKDLENGMELRIQRLLQAHTWKHMCTRLRLFYCFLSCLCLTFNFLYYLLSFLHFYDFLAVLPMVSLVLVLILLLLSFHVLCTRGAFIS